ncbi:MAG: dihydropteroate synthase [Bacteroidota bacterium]
MGILNITPDSFYDGGKLTNTSTTLDQARKMLSEGATFLDIGGYSSRPGAKDVSEEEELSRVLPAIQAIISEFPNALLSVDTFRSKVAKEAVRAGAVMVNDISGGRLDEQMIPVVAELQVPYVLMHMRGTPQTMDTWTHYEDLVKEVVHYFSERLLRTREAGINDVILDPGFGFSKTLEQNFELLNTLELLEHLDAPLLVGLSRKSMIYRTLGITAKDALNGTTSLHTIALQKGAHILRVHDVKPAME